MLCHVGKQGQRVVMLKPPYLLSSIPAKVHPGANMPESGFRDYPDNLQVPLSNTVKHGRAGYKPQGDPELSR